MNTFVGNTPLVRLYNLEKELNWKGQLWAKNEFLNPTGSFKDRGSITEINAAIAGKKKGVVCASTGNMAASLSSFAAKNNISCTVIVPKNTPDGKIKQARICGATILTVKGSYDDCVEKAKTYSIENNFLLCGDYELRRIGQTTVGIELAKCGIDFDAFIAPIGNGTLGSAIAQGFAMYGKFPKFIGVQGKGADPIYQAWKNRSKIISPILNPDTTASAMNVGNPLDGLLTLDLIAKTDGQMFVVSDLEIKKDQSFIAKNEGLYIEKSAAATVSVIKKIIDRTLTIVLIFTGNGLKE